METFLVFLALLVASATLYVQRVHNRKQVLPIMHLYEQHHDEDEIREVEMRLHNDGLGPAIISKVTLTINEDFHNIETWSQLNEQLQKSFPFLEVVAISLPYCLKANSDETLYKLGVPIEHWDEFRRTNLEISIEVQSVYEDTVTTTFDGTKYISNKHDQIVESLLGKVSSFVKSGQK